MKKSARRSVEHEQLLAAQHVAAVRALRLERHVVGRPAGAGVPQRQRARAARRSRAAPGSAPSARRSRPSRARSRPACWRGSGPARARSRAAPSAPPARPCRAPVRRTVSETIRPGQFRSLISRHRSSLKASSDSARLADPLGLQPRGEELPRRGLQHLLLVGQVEIHVPLPLTAASAGRAPARPRCSRRMSVVPPSIEFARVRRNWYCQSPPSEYSDPSANCAVRALDLHRQLHQVLVHLGPLPLAERALRAGHAVLHDLGQARGSW